MPKPKPQKPTAPKLDRKTIEAKADILAKTLFEMPPQPRQAFSGVMSMLPFALPCFNSFSPNFLPLFIGEDGDS